MIMFMLTTWIIAIIIWHSSQYGGKLLQTPLPDMVQKLFLVDMLIIAIII